MQLKMANTNPGTGMRGETEIHGLLSPEGIYFSFFFANKIFISLEHLHKLF